MDLLFIGVASMMGERETTWSGLSLAFDTCIAECQEEPGITTGRARHIWERPIRYHTPPVVVGCQMPEGPDD
jgi:hypothetical protein